MSVQIRKRGKDPKVKPILINKEDPSCVSDPSTLPSTASASNHFEEMHPKDELELLQSSLATEKVSPADKSTTIPFRVVSMFLLIYMWCLVLLYCKQLIMYVFIFGSSCNGLTKTLRI